MTELFAKSTNVELIFSSKSPRYYIHAMTEKEPHQSSQITELERKLDQLIALYNTVKSENEVLRDKQISLVREKAQLVEKTTLAKNRVEAMITRLKAMGQGS